MPKDKAAARSAVRTLRNGIRTLADYPDIGRPVDDLEREFREWFIPFGESGYVVLYQRSSDAVVILAIRHGKEAGYGSFYGKADT